MEVKLLLDAVTATVEAKIDTGSSYCIFQRKYGETLGLDVETGLLIKIATVTGNFIAYGHFVTISVLDYQFDSFLYFAADESFTRNVLGRHGWLDHFRIAIIDYEGKLYLNPYD